MYRMQLVQFKNLVITTYMFFASYFTYSTEIVDGIRIQAAKMLPVHTIVFFCDENYSCTNKMSYLRLQMQILSGHLGDRSAESGGGIPPEMVPRKQGRNNATLFLPE
jgi:hypothetical protein